MKSDISANCDDSRYYVMWCFAVIMFTLVGFVIPVMVFWRLYYNPNHWHCHDEEQCIFSIGDFVAFRSPRVFYSSLSTSISIEVDAKLADFAPGSSRRVELESETIEQVATLFEIPVAEVSLTGLLEEKLRDPSKQGKLRWLDRSNGENKWIKCSVRLEGNHLTWRSTMMAAGDRPYPTLLIDVYIRCLTTQQRVCYQETNPSATRPLYQQLYHCGRIALIKLWTKIHTTLVIMAIGMFSWRYCAMPSHPWFLLRSYSPYGL